MTDRARRAYLGMARLFLAVGGAVALLGLADAAAGLELFRGSPIGTSLFLLAIGGLLYWTANTAPRRDGDEVERGATPPRDDDG